jgi:hypothetical protein
MKTLPMSKKKRYLILLSAWFLACGVGSAYLFYCGTHPFDILIGGVGLIVSIFMFIVCEDKSNKME